MMRFGFLRLASVAAGVFLALSASAQWTTQTLELRPGWNAVYLEVEPGPNDCDSVFEGLPLESAWTWNGRGSPVQFIDDPDELVPENPRWLAHYPPTSNKRFLRNLYTVRGGKSYLLAIGGDEAVTWQVSGRPVLQSTDWVADSLNLVGFPLPEAGPTFLDFFTPSKAHAGQLIYRLRESEHWERVADPAAERIRQGEAFWVYTDGPSDYQGPLRLTFEQGNGLDFGRGLTELELRLKNETTGTRTYTLAVRGSEPPGSPDAPVPAGDVPLSYWKQDLANEIRGWLPLDEPVAMTLDAGEQRLMRLAVRRADMAAYVPAKPGDAPVYQGFIEASDSETRLLIPVTSLGLGPTGPYAGLWVGWASVNAVSEHFSGAGGETTPQPASSEFQFRLILHMNDSGGARLLRDAVHLWRPPVYDGTGALIEPGRYVLFTDLELLDQFVQVHYPDGNPMGRRISSPAFGFEGPLAATSGTFPTPSEQEPVVSFTVPLDYNDPLNPFKHKYHPDHNNLDASYGIGVPVGEGEGEGEGELDPGVLPPGVESYTVTRALQLAFSADDPEGLELAGWGDTELGGHYQETVTGIHRESIVVKGLFRLRHVSDTAELNPQP